MLINLVDKVRVLRVYGYLNWLDSSNFWQNHIRISAIGAQRNYCKSHVCKAQFTVHDQFPHYFRKSLSLYLRPKALFRCILTKHDA